MSQVLTVHLSTELYDCIMERAASANRSIEAEALDMLTATAASTSGKESTQQRFRQLANSWHKAVAHLSSSSKRESHPAYQAIIAMGPPVVPYLLSDLNAHGRHWFTALTAITGDNPVPEKDAGVIPRMIDAWLHWGRAKGHQW